MCCKSSDGGKNTKRVAPYRYGQRRNSSESRSSRQWHPNSLSIRLPPTNSSSCSPPVADRQRWVQQIAHMRRYGRLGDALAIRHIGDLSIH